MTYLGVDSRDLAEGMVGWGSGSCSYRSNKWTFISVGGLKHIRTAPANIHYVETRLHTTDNRVGWSLGWRTPSHLKEGFKVSAEKQTHWLLCGKSSRCCMVTKGWMRASAGAILSSASINNIFFSKPTNSLRSAFSANKSLPSRFIIKFTCSGNSC